MNHQTLCELNGYLFCLLLPWCTASTICDIAHTSHLSLQIPPPEKKTTTLSPVISALCHLVVFFKINEWRYQPGCVCRATSGWPSLHHSDLNTLLLLFFHLLLFPAGSFFGFFSSLTTEWGIALPQHITSIAYCCCSSSSAGFFQPPLPIITCSR